MFVFLFEILLLIESSIVGGVLVLFTLPHFVGFAYQGKDIVFRFIIEYSSLRDFGPKVIGLFLYEFF
jgi:hypothetical protein